MKLRFVAAIQKFVLNEPAGPVSLPVVAYKGKTKIRVLLHYIGCGEPGMPAGQQEFFPERIEFPMTQKIGKKERIIPFVTQHQPVSALAV